MEVKIVEFSRPSKSVPWGFSIQGGREFGCPLSVLRVNPGSIADKLGVTTGDLIMKINEVLSETMTHQQAILQIQNLEVILEVKKGEGSSGKEVETNPPPVIDSHSFNNNCRISTQPIPPKPIFTIPPPPIIPPAPNVSQPSFTPLSKVSQPIPLPKPKDLFSKEKSYEPTNRYVPPVALDSNKVDLFLKQLNESDTIPSDASTTLSNFLQNKSKNQGRDSKDLLVQQTNQDNSSPICFVCKDHIKGSYIEANKKIYCSDHFCCSYCDKTIKSSQFIETKEGILYCMEDFKNNVAPRCAKCSNPIIEDQIMALDKCWHSGCFLCDHCKRPIQQGHFHVTEDNGVISVYCEKDYKEHYEIKCTGCAFPIDGDDKYLMVNGKNYHVNCFKK